MSKVLQWFPTVDYGRWLSAIDGLTPVNQGLQSGPFAQWNELNEVVRRAAQRGRELAVIPLSGWYSANATPVTSGTIAGACRLPNGMDAIFLVNKGADTCYNAFAGFARWGGSASHLVRTQVSPAPSATGLQDVLYCEQALRPSCEANAAGADRAGFPMLHRAHNAGLLRFVGLVSGSIHDDFQRRNITLSSSNNFTFGWCYEPVTQVWVFAGGSGVWRSTNPDLFETAGNTTLGPRIVTAECAGSGRLCANGEGEIMWFQLNEDAASHGQRSISSDGGVTWTQRQAPVATTDKYIIDLWWDAKNGRWLSIERTGVIGSVDFYGLYSYTRDGVTRALQLDLTGDYGIHGIANQGVCMGDQHVMANGNADTLLVPGDTRGPATIFTISNDLVLTRMAPFALTTGANCRVDTDGCHLYVSSTSGLIYSSRAGGSPLKNVGLNQ